ncbi:TIGR02647 family protein [Marinobacter sp. ANT_B65]|uniref:TIGR02647 family protein n=1 Tax=Marinobacter sp. ANT_B65 TaxID=2039467 RepID=UPI000BBF0236|nr:TIGR02647 family protein [Marinobacter sp. ANT_B65]PCM45048.1 TIGR02647 family protein [Marinobacter sp. ANT_B65]
MPFSPDHIAELNLLSQFESSSGQAGIKVHRHDAAPETVEAAERLFAKGLITRDDGGYLTPLGSEAVELTQKLQSIITS